MSVGVIYVAIGERYIQEALCSVQSLKQFMPEIHTTIFCNRELESIYFDRRITINELQSNRRKGLIEKIRGIRNSPYEKPYF
jgi:hypothetical protein